MLSANTFDSSGMPQVWVPLNQRSNEERRFPARNTFRPHYCESALALRTRTTLELISTRRCGLPQLTDIRDLQRELKTQGVQLLTKADEAASGPASFMLEDPDGNQILVDQHVSGSD